MPEINFAPFGQDILKKQTSEAVNRAIWCCIAPYLLRPKSKRMISNLKTTYLAQLVLDLDRIKLKSSDRRIKQMAYEWQSNTRGWIEALVDAPNRSDIDDYEWGLEDSETKTDYLTTYRIVALYLRMIRSIKEEKNNRKKEKIWFSIQNAIFICQSDPLQGYHSADDKIWDALRRYKKSSHLIFGMLQAAANAGTQNKLIPPTLEHVDLLREKGHESVRDGLQYAAYAQRELTSAKPRNTRKPWLLRQEAWMLPKGVGNQDEQIERMFAPLTEQEISYVRNAPERVKRRLRTATTSP
jgi:hypothetical protein